MSKEDGKPSLLERFEEVRLILEHSKCSPVNIPFPTRFVKLRVKGDDFKLAKIEGNNVVTPTRESFIAQMLSQWCERNGFRDYNFTPSQLKSCVEHFINKLVLFEEDIHLVLQKSKPGYCYHRLDFDMEEKETPTFDSLTNFIECNKDAMLGFMGSLFDPKVTLQQYCWLYGEGQNGKGTMFRFLRKLMGPSYGVYETDQKRMNNFSASALLNKRLAVASDCMNPYVVTTSFFKAVTGGDEVQIEEKMKPLYSDILPCQFLFGSNEQPFISSKRADLRRAIFVRFGEVPSEAFIERFEEKLWEERAGILWKFWEAWRRLRINDNKLQVDLSAQAQLAEDNEERFEDFFFDHLIVVEDGTGNLRAGELMEAFKERTHGKTSVKELSELKGWLERQGFQTVRKSGAKGKSLPRSYPNLALRDASNPSF